MYHKPASSYIQESKIQLSMVSLEFFVDIFLAAALWPWGRLSL